MADRFLEITDAFRIPFAELHFRTSRSGGPGGQNVNKLETRVELFFNVLHSPGIPESIRFSLSQHLRSRLTDEGILRLVANGSRSQWQNKQDVLDRLRRLMQKAMQPEKRRIKTTPGRLSVKVRIERKRRRGTQKKLRKMPQEDS
jgi:ribosome-associated protein